MTVSLDDREGAPRPRILHIAEDSMFIARFAEWMEAHDAANTYLVSRAAGREDLKFKIAADRVRTTSSQLESARVARSMARDFDVVVVHYMTVAGAAAFHAAKRKTMLLWSGFGADYYSRTDERSDSLLLEPETAAAVAEAAGRRSLSPPRALRRALSARLIAGAARRATHFSAPVPTDLAIFQQRFPSFSGEYLQLNYATSTGLMPASDQTQGHDVLLGNSATPTNNHLDLFTALAAVPLDGRKVVVPLTYGDTGGYRDAVVRAGRERFGSDFVPLLDFMSLDDYHAAISSCGHMIMGQKRQQAVGNVITGLLGGMDVVLHEASPVLTFLREHGAHVRGAGSLARTSLDDAVLDAEARAQNRRVVEEFWGEAKVRDNIAELVRAASKSMSTGRSRT